jgi:hypothetical protein
MKTVVLSLSKEGYDILENYPKSYMTIENLFAQSTIISQSQVPVTMPHNQFRKSSRLPLLITFLVPVVSISCTGNDKVQTEVQESANNPMPSNKLQVQNPTGLTRASENGQQMRVFIDPETGEMRPPTPEEAKALDKSVPQRPLKTADELQPIKYPDGTMSIQLDERQIRHTTIKICEDGTLSTSCQTFEKSE